MPNVTAASGPVVLGFGLGGLADGVVLHQVLQWHHLWSARTPDTTLEGLETNTLADGVFHVACLVVLVAGVALVTRRRVGPRELVAWGAAGWGAFHVADQLVFHLALGAHHVRDDVANYQLYDWGFFALGVLMIVAGVVAARRLGR